MGGNCGRVPHVLSVMVCAATYSYNLSNSALFSILSVGALPTVSRASTLVPDGLERIVHMFMRWGLST
jgi:hypothetical protein